MGELQKLCGVDLSRLFPELSKNKAQVVYGVWLRNAMGLTYSPYCSYKTVLLAKRMIMGDRIDEESAYHWDRVWEKLPLLDNYQANVPLLQKIRNDKELACKVLQYVDDLRIICFFVGNGVAGEQPDGQGTLLVRASRRLSTKEKESE